MNKLQTLALGLISSSVLFMSACSKNNDDTTTPVATLKTNTVTDLDGSKGNVYYSLANNAVVTGADTTGTKWDVKFSGTSIFINSGSSGTGTTQAQVVSSTFADLTTAPTSGYKADATGAAAITGWYTYTATTAPQHAILMVPGKIIVVKTSAGNYAKIEMKSYYKGNPDTTTPTFADLTTRPASRIYTFRFAYQANGTTSLQ
ncbi:HmuY family protein [Mucilaginibacter jinjuensis]|uniref:HmuY family protein n=1 Tax=Mucilaginibacter jinjuensis TaxID=1176721 RepID=A0ABY7T1G2_9SPHI|nr:HmuY family protein [Mucilaginibacter jinjuensis]WCT10231.1 HmuY family protein [Mucilaginibacter jinjuensis]